MVPTVRLHGDIRQTDGGRFVIRCFELKTSTGADSFAEVGPMILDMIQAYFQACAKVGSLQAELARMGVKLPADAIDVEAELTGSDHLKVVSEQRVELRAA